MNGSRVLWLVLVALVFQLVGCASMSPAVRDQVDSLPQVASLEVDSVKVKVAWDRAQVWIVKHSAWKIQTATDVLIETYNASGDSPTYAFTVMKEPATGGAAVITMKMVCGNLFGCNPSKERVRAAFFHYVSTGEDVLAAGETGPAIR